jgi:hypothetical protein
MIMAYACEKRKMKRSRRAPFRAFVPSAIALMSFCDGLQETPLSRRRLLETGCTVGGTWLMLPNEPAFAAKGAAELDFEFYMRDLMGGNKKGGTIQASKPLVVPPPRTLQGPLLPLLLDDDCSPACIPVQALIQQIKKRNGGDDRAIAEDIQSRVRSLREKTSRSFFARTPWKVENVSDQYYFDITAYALWRTAGDLLPDFPDRDKFVRSLGKMMYEKLQSEKLVSSQMETGKGNTPLVSAIPATMEILELFKSSQYCKGYRIRADDSKDVVDFLFDELDDEDLADGGTVDCLVSLYEPATLGASLQITGEQSRFGPDLVATTLAALWDDAGIRSSWDTFFVDPEYRPNPKDYFANEQLIQFSLKKKKN